MDVSFLNILREQREQDQICGVCVGLLRVGFVRLAVLGEVFVRRCRCGAWLFGCIGQVQVRV